MYITKRQLNTLVDAIHNYDDAKTEWHKCVYDTHDSGGADYHRHSFTNASSYLDGVCDTLSVVIADYDLPDGVYGVYFAGAGIRDADNKLIMLFSVDAKNKQITYNIYEDTSACAQDSKQKVERFIAKC